MSLRQNLSLKYARGRGLEIAPLHFPWPIHPQVEKVTYLDLFTIPQLRAEYPEHDRDHLTYCEIIGDGQYCYEVETDSMDFVFSSHVIEHCPFTITAIRNWIRVLKPGGHLLMAVPQKNNPIDKDRVPTTWQHCLTEYEQAHCYYRDHYTEYFAKVDHLEGKALSDRVDVAVLTKPHVHFHCWEVEGIRELLTNTQALLGSFEMIEFIPAGHEVLTVLKKL